jgi:uncharacterized protein
MPHVARLFRFPVKGMTPEPRERLRVLESGAVEGDRVLGFLRADAGPAERQVDGRDWWRKPRFVQLMDVPGVARLRVAYEVPRLALSAGESTVAEGDVTVEADRERLATMLSEYVASLDGRHAASAGALRLVGDGVAPTFHDRGPRHVTLVGTGSLAALERALSAEVDERRFRMNIVVDGLEAWEELGWVGRSVSIGGLEFEASGPVVRCLATHANPETGERDAEVLTTLTRVFGQEEPTMGILLRPKRAGEVSVGDEVTLG